jgi:hypothetical protein
VSDFDSITFELDKDPAPNSGKSGNTKPRRGRPPNSARKPALEKELTDELTMFIQLASAPLILRDPVCAGAVQENAGEIAAATAAILIDHKRAVAFLQSGGSMMKYIKLVMALSPVVLTVRAHHFAGEMENANGYSAGTVAGSAPGFSGGMGQG